MHPAPMSVIDGKLSRLLTATFASRGLNGLLM
jgi:hypothetical protein